MVRIEQVLGLGVVSAYSKFGLDQGICGHSVLRSNAPR